ncbi:MAG: shikimate dehydrogenase [Phreatobacter sp.]
MSARAKRRILLGLVGHPIAHSAAPAAHEALAQAVGLEAFYHLIEVPGAGREGLRSILDGVRATGFAGVNITYPYKEMAAGLVDELSPDVAAMGAINTVVISAGRLIGHNTDMSGFRTAYDRFVGLRGPRSVALFGAGGVGRAIAHALARPGGPVLRLYDPDRVKAEDLAGRLPGTAVLTSSVEEAIDGVEAIINATPLGMAPDKRSPVPPALIEASHLVIEVVYSPLFTPLLTAAHRQGARYMTGRDLFVHQAIDAFRLFTGLEGSESAVGAAFDRVMAGRQSPSAAEGADGRRRAG